MAAAALFSTPSVCPGQLGARAGPADAAGQRGAARGGTAGAPAGSDTCVPACSGNQRPRASLRLLLVQLRDPPLRRTWRAGGGRRTHPVGAGTDAGVCCGASGRDVAVSRDAAAAACQQRHDASYVRKLTSSYTRCALQEEQAPQ